MIFTINNISTDGDQSAAGNETKIKQTDAAEQEIKIEQKADTDTLHCKNHANTETLLRCNKCNEPICMKCAVQTAVGYRCKECIRGVQDKFFNAERMDYPIAFLTSLVVTAIASPIAALLLGSLGIFLAIIIMMFVGSGAGGMLAQIVRRAVGKRRGRYLRHFMIGGVVAGILVGAVIGLFFGVWVFNLPTLIFATVVSVTAYGFLR